MTRAGSSLDSLPPELCLWVCDYLSSRELFCFSLTCKAYRNCYEPLVDQKRHVEKYADITFHRMHSDIRPFLYDFLQKPSLLPLVRKLTISSNLTFNLGSHGGVYPDELPARARETKLDKEFPDYCNLLVESVRTSHYLNQSVGSQPENEFAHYTGSIEDAIRKGDRGPLYAYFLELLPNLEELVWPSSPRRFRDLWMLRLLKHTVGMNARACHSLPFRSLTRVELTDGDGWRVDTTLARYFLRIPSLRSFSVLFWYGLIERSKVEIEPNFPLSRVTSLCLQIRFTTPSAVSQMLDGITYLKEFCMGMGSGRGWNYASRSVIELLAPHASHSLEVLKLNWGEWRTGSVSTKIISKALSFHRRNANGYDRILPSPL